MEAALRVEAFEQPQNADLVFRGRTWNARVLGRGMQRGIIGSSAQVEVGGLVLCELHGPDRSADWLTMECAVSRVLTLPSPDDGLSTYEVRWRWAWCPAGPAALLWRLSGFLECETEDVGSVGFHEVDGGGLYAFSEKLAPLAIQTVRRTLLGRDDPIGSRVAMRGPAPVFTTTGRMQRPFVRLRSNERLRVQHPCRVSLGEDEHSAVLHDVSRDGAYVASKWTLPKKDQPVCVTFAPVLHGGRPALTLAGRVRWVCPEDDLDRPRGFGIVVDHVDDGEEGRLFHRYIDHLVFIRDEMSRRRHP